MSGSSRARLEQLLGPAEVDRQIRTWSAMIPVLESGGHCPHHLHGSKPA